ncbi:MAG: DUF3108 domain-containing protein [Litorivicinaceae bacterium]|nr:DUF3108 domain-containing protein [Litorivicinaceae bacterium]
MMWFTIRALWWFGISLGAIAAEPYTAKYQMTWQVGVKLSAQATETLRVVDGIYTLELAAQAAVGSATETTHLMRSEEGQWQPLDYTYTQTLLGRTETRSVRFNRNQGTVSILHAPDQPEQAIPDGALDPLGFRLVMTEQLTAGLLPESQTLPLLDGDTVTLRRIDRVSVETLSLPIGEIEAIRFKLTHEPERPDRQFHFWLAPSLQYQLVKLDKQDGKRRIALELVSYQAGTDAP